MHKLEVLAAAHGWGAVEGEAWGFAATLDSETRRTVELALAKDGVYGVCDLAIQGVALGGLYPAIFGSLVAAVEAGLVGELVAA